VKVELSQDIVSQIGVSAVLVDPIERVVGSLDRQRWDVQSLTVRRDCGDPGGDAQAKVAEVTQLLHDIIDLMCARPLQTENGFGIVEDYEHLL